MGSNTVSDRCEYCVFRLQEDVWGMVVVVLAEVEQYDSKGRPQGSHIQQADKYGGVDDVRLDRFGMGID